MTDVLTVEQLDQLEVWTLDRPEALNAFNRPLLEALNRELDRLSEAGPEEAPRAVVIAGAGERAFSAGADLKERKAMPPDQVPIFVNLIGNTMTRIARASIPFVAAVHGFAFGGGMECALACDLRVVGPRAKLGLTETRLGIIPGAGGTQRLSRLVGLGRAKSLILTGRRIDAEAALRIGLAEFDAEDGRCKEVALEVAASIAECGPVAIRAAKDSLDRGFDLPMEAALRVERECYDRTLGTSDRVEALVAFAEKRKPRFLGR